ncbi:MAG: outer membrane protein assembly factor BamA [Burkholderiaceae bacterium]|jgi:outer membrane protein insertion porin family|nr:outer membrane protein assembly factor BamA [Burkholderiaceae bacterium]
MNSTKNYRSRILRQILVLGVGVFSTVAAWAVEPFTIQDIRVEGLQRIEPGTVFASLPFHVGDTYTDADGSTAIRSLFNLGLFKDVRVDIKDGVVVVIVEERPIVASISFSGLREFNKDALTKALVDIGLAEGRPFDKALADRAEQELKRQYVNRSLYNADVVSTVTPVDKNRVNVSFTVTEGQPARISAVRIVGNQAFSESKLLGQLAEDSGNWMSWYTKSNRYARTKLNADLETLRAYYQQRGYLEFQINSTDVALSPDRQSVTLTINVTEGPKYVVSGVKLAGNYLGRDDEFKALVDIRPGAPFNSEQVASTVKAFTDYFASFGYAFAKVDVQPELDRTNDRVAFTLQADPRQRVYVRHINIAGNSRTRDVVIRREFRQFEDSWYDGDRIKLSRARVNRLGYFTDVNVEASQVPGTPDQVDLDVKVKEKPTGSVQLGAGYSTTDKVSFSFGISQDNVFGSGNFLGLQANTSSYNRTIQLTSTDPYFTTSGISRTFNLYYQSTKPYYNQDGEYRLTHEGGALSFGVPFSELDTIYFGAGAERYSFNPGSYYVFATPQAYRDYFGCTTSDPTNPGNLYATVTGCSKSSVWGIPLTIAWARDSRDSALVPTSGRFQRANLEIGTAGQMKYYRANYNFQQYIPLSKRYTLAFNTNLGYGKPYGNEVYPVFKNFYAGGLGSIRGFQQNTLGPQDIYSGAAVGGSKLAVGTLQINTPFPGADNDPTLQLYGFVDVGNVFADRTAGMTDAQWSAQQKIRASAGVGISWISPIGPLQLSYAVPIKYQKADSTNGVIEDRIQRFQFQIGTSF